MVASNAPPSPLRLNHLSAQLGAEVWAQPITATLSSPSDDENAVAAELGPLRGPHFTAGRLAARASLDRYGARPSALPREATGAVGWPFGFVGAIAHTPSLAVAITAQRRLYFGVGIDVERSDRRLAPATRRLVARPEESAWLDHPPRSHVDPLMLLVAAKEVIFKAYFPHTQVRLRYHDARLEPVEEGFRATILRRELSLPLEMYIVVHSYDDYLVLGGVIAR